MLDSLKKYLKNKFEYNKRYDLKLLKEEIKKFLNAEHISEEDMLIRVLIFELIEDSFIDACLFPITEDNPYFNLKGE